MFDRLNVLLFYQHIYLYTNIFPLSDFSPPKPELMDWSKLYPEHCKPVKPVTDFKHDDVAEDRTNLDQSQVKFADIGCGYGGLLGMFMWTEYYFKL